MNCKHVEELLPLYIGGDLEAGRAGLVMAHLQSCTHCAGSAAEYKETQQWIEMFEPPLFSEAVYTGIRRNVLDEINREATAPTLWQLAFRLFQPRAILVVSSALVLAVCALAFFFIYRRLGQPSPANKVVQQLKSKNPTTVVAPFGAPSPGAQQPPSTAQRAGSPDEHRRRVGSVSVPGARSTTSNNRNRQLKQRKTILDDGAESVAAKTQTDEVPQEIEDRAEPADSTTRALDRPGKSLRIEMQTNDENIRIIWFSRQQVQEDSTNKSNRSL